MKIGVLAVQGAFIEHISMLSLLSNQINEEIECVELRQKSDLEGIDGLILPGGESTVQGQLLKKLDMTIDDMDLIEANEAFAAQSIAVGRDLNFDLNKLNVNGGAIALGHPVGASGCRILVTLLHEMQRRDAKKGLATLCIGGGMGTAMIVERK